MAYPPTAQEVELLAGLDPDLANRALWLLYLVTYYGGRIRIAEGRRSAARQRQLFDAGYSRTLQSKHLTGHAFDIDFEGLHPNSVPDDSWGAVGYLGEWLGLTWGGRFRSIYDPRHFEL